MSQWRKDHRKFEKDYFWTYPRAFLASVVTLIGLVALGFGLNFFGYAQFAFFNPKYEQVRRNTFEQSQAYVEGQRRDIQNLRIDWMSATGDQKAAIRSLALTRINGLPEEVVSMPAIQSFKRELETQ